MTVTKGQRVGVLMGGMSSERAVSLKSGKAVLGALKDRGWDAVGIDVGPDLAARLTEEKVKVAWLALHGRYGEDGCVQGMLEVMQIPYTGSGVLASSVAMDKAATKRMLRGVDGLVMARDALVGAGAPLPDLTLPIILKPVRGGSTIGVTKVYHAEEWDAALASTTAEGAEILVEELIVGDEITVAVVDGRALPVVRILPDSGFFDFEAKYTEGRTVYEAPARVAPSVFTAAQLAAEAAYRTLGCRGLARSDFMIRADGTPIFLEINTIPGMTATSLSPMAASCLGEDFPALVERILLSATLDPR
jgi:D-alanine-D-alanine ligase